MTDSVTLALYLNTYSRSVCKLSIWLTLMNLTGLRFALWKLFKPPSKMFLYWPFQGGTSFVDHFFSYLCFVLACFLVCLFSCLFVVALWSPAGKGLTSWISCVWCFIVILLLSHVVSWVRCGAWFYQSLIFAFFLTFETTCLQDMPEHNYLEKDVNSTGHNSLAVKASASGAEGRRFDCQCLWQWFFF